MCSFKYSFNPFYWKHYENIGRPYKYLRMKSLACLHFFHEWIKCPILFLLMLPTKLCMGPLCQQKITIDGGEDYAKHVFLKRWKYLDKVLLKHFLQTVWVVLQPCYTTWSPFSLSVFQGKQVPCHIEDVIQYCTLNTLTQILVFVCFAIA